MRWNTATGMAGDFTGDFLEAQRRAMEKLQRTGDALQELRRAPLRRLVARPQNVADLGHRREAVFHRGGIALRFPRITPGPVDAQAALAACIFARDVVLVVGACWLQLFMAVSSLVGPMPGDRREASIDIEAP